MKNIIITQRLITQKGRIETLDGLDRQFSQFLSRDLDYLLFPIPSVNVEDELLLRWIKCANPTLIILSGGGDVGDDPNRDQLEASLIQLSLQLNIPLLGICRGMQHIALHQGVSLKKVTEHVGTEHRITGEYNMCVNSFHNYSIEKCPSDFTVTSWSDDFEIESIRHNSSKIEGWMWHPEREDGTDGPMKKEFKRFLKNLEKRGKL